MTRVARGRDNFLMVTGRQPATRRPRIRRGALNPAWARPDHDVTGNNTRTSPPWRRRGTLARSVRNVEPSAHVSAWAEEFFARYAPGEDAKRFASRAQWPFDPDEQEQEKEETR